MIFCGLTGKRSIICRAKNQALSEFSKHQEFPDFWSNDSDWIRANQENIDELVLAEYMEEKDEEEKQVKNTEISQKSKFSSKNSKSEPGCSKNLCSDSRHSLTPTRQKSRKVTPPVENRIYDPIQDKYRTIKSSLKVDIGNISDPESLATDTGSDAVPVSQLNLDSHSDENSNEDLEIRTDDENPDYEPETETREEPVQDSAPVGDGSGSEKTKKRPHTSDSDSSPVKPVKKQTKPMFKPGEASHLVNNRYSGKDQEYTEPESELSSLRPENKYDQQYEERCPPVKSPEKNDPKFSCQDIREKQKHGIPLDPPREPRWPRKKYNKNNTPKKSQRLQNKQGFSEVSPGYNRGQGQGRGQSRGGRGHSRGRNRSSSSRRRRPIIPTFTSGPAGDDDDSDSGDEKRGKAKRKDGWK